MIFEYFKNYLAKIKETKKLAREKNVPLWAMSVFDSVMIAILVSWQLSVVTWMLLGDWQTALLYTPSYMEILWDFSTYSPLI